MPLSKPVRRKLHHRRQIVCEGYEREDGLWDIEARMTDKKTNTLDNPERGGFVAAGEYFHDIRMRLTLDRSLKIHQVEASMDATPFQMCPGIVAVYKRLEGTRIGSGWHRKALELTGGVQGCTHLNELLKPLTTTAIQTLWPSGDEDMVKLGAKGLLNTCHTWAQNSPAVQQYLPELYLAEPPNG
ncbi:DUF2889 domain-containing protein [Nitrincola sp.]|uniref:DUF2889 domain-containing protein n=1 Tax=Nitrincola sp. TaxID=1926584 RepID=UPI003A8FF766